jgi:hypothetical protein
VQVPTDVNFRTVSVPTVEDVGEHAAAWATSAATNVNAPIDEMDRTAAVNNLPDRDRTSIWAV